MLLWFCYAWLLAAQTPDWRDAGIVDTRHSSEATLHGVPVSAVKMADGFWAGRMRINMERSLPTMLEQLEQHGAVDNFRRLSGSKHVERRGPLYTDSDVYKWMEAVAFVLQGGDRPQLRETLQRLTGEILAAQEPSGYLNTYWSGERAGKRFTEHDARTRTLLPGPPAAGGHRLLPRHRGPQVAGWRQTLCRLPGGELRTTETPRSDRTSRIGDGAGGVVPHHRRAPLPGFRGIPAQRRRARAAAT